MKWILLLLVVTVLRFTVPLFIAKPAAPPSANDKPPLSAAVRGDAARLRQLLAQGADANAADREGMTPLMEAATTDLEKVSLLLAAKADVRARSKLGNDALILAARRPGNAKIVKCLLEHGAEVNGRNAFGATPLMAAVAAEDGEVVDLLVASGADVNAQPNPDLAGFLFGGGRTPLMWAAYRRNAALVEKLLKHGARVNESTGLGSALSHAAWASDCGIARLLIAAGANVNQRDLKWQFTPLHWAAASEYSDPSLVSLLLEHGADVNAEGGQNVDNFMGVPQTPLMLALQRGETRIVEALRTAGARPRPSTETKQPMLRPADRRDDTLAMVSAAIAPLLQTATESPRHFLAHASRQNCASCHQQHVPMLAFSAVKARDLAIDPVPVQSVQEGIEKFHTNSFGPEAVFYPEPAIEFGYALMGLHSEGKPRSAMTDALLHHLLVIQAGDGRWHYNMPRPPLQSSDITATALAVRALTLYSIPGREAEIAGSIQRGLAWLEKVTAETNEEKAYKLLGLAWAGSPPTQIQQAGAALLSAQREDGGWGQLEKLPADAYATGLTLYALMSSGTAKPGDTAVAGGVQFLRRTQCADGTWHVRRRAVPFQPPMKSGFPHGADAWISSAGTSWAVLALTMADDPMPAPVKQTAPQAPAKSASSTPSLAPATDTFDFKWDIAAVLQRSCSGCHSGDNPKGNYAVTSRAALLQGGNRGEPAVDFANLDESPLLRAMRDQIEDFEMPPLAMRAKYPPVIPEEIAKFKAWLALGAPWPQETAFAAK